MEISWVKQSAQLAGIIEGSVVHKSWKGKKVVIVGAARQGTALARYLSKQGAKLVITDAKTKDELGPSIEMLADLDIDWALGGHPVSLLESADLVCVSGGVPLTTPLIRAAIVQGIPVSNDSQIFLEAVPGKTIGITGSAGKTTTTTLLGDIAQKYQLKPALPKRYRKIWVGGNIGHPLIADLDAMSRDDLVIMELSSFQLEIMKLSPSIAAILNITPNHLDRHGTMDAYIEAKAQLLANQTNCDIAVLNREDVGAWSLRQRVKGNLLTFGLGWHGLNLSGAYVKDGWIYFQGDSGGVEKILPLGEIQLRGQHNLFNILAACTIARAAEIPIESIRAGVAAFKGVAHRLEHVRSWKEVDWYNDSIATAPERSMAAIRSFDEPIVLLAGGRDKDLPWDEFASLVTRRVRALILFGEAAGKIERAIKTVPGENETILIRCSGLKDAIQAAAEVARSGDVVLLSPGGTSFDEFKDFEERGECFRKWVMEL